MNTYNQTLKKGDTWNGVQFQYILNDTPIDLTGSVIKIEFRFLQKEGQLTATLTIGNGITLTDAQNGIFVIDPILITWKVGTHFFDIQLTDNTGIVKTYVEGIFTITQDITQ